MSEGRESEVKKIFIQFWKTQALWKNKTQEILIFRRLVRGDSDNSEEFDKVTTES